MFLRKKVEILQRIAFLGITYIHRLLCCFRVFWISLFTNIVLYMWQNHITKFVCFQVHLQNASSNSFKLLYYLCHVFFLVLTFSILSTAMNMNKKKLTFTYKKLHFFIFFPPGKYCGSPGNIFPWSSRSNGISENSNIKWLNNTKFYRI